MGPLLRRHAWLLPVAVALLLAGVGWNAYVALERSVKAQLASRLEAFRSTAIAALDLWADDARAVVEVHAARPEVQREAWALLELARTTPEPREALLASPELARLRGLVDPVSASHGFEAWAVVARSGVFVAARTDRNIGRRVPGIFEQTTRMAQGETIVTAPTVVRLLDQQPQGLVLVGGALPGPDGQARATFGFSFDPQNVYGRLLVAERTGDSGETFAFDHEGTLISPSRFDAQLREIGLLPADPAVRSALNVEIRDPGGDLTQGFEPTATIKARPFTVAAAAAITGETGVDVAGYRSYRGVPVLGAWAWVPELGVGIASEIEVSEAYAGLDVLRTQFAFLVGAFAIAALAMILYSLVVMRLRREVDAARQVGRYRIERKLGAGGMGAVYLARHALLRRPTAVKILGADRAGHEGIARFEREVQVSSSLSHPNTIEIYDFGYTPEGTFYYAMEHVNGPTLGECVKREGAQPEARVLHLVKQAAGSIAEAHARGLMHRDIKPGNLMLCERGGVYDYVKVLDFGLVKEQKSGTSVTLTDAASLTGTPLYMPPEAAQAPETLDVRGDVYQLGLVAYYLLVGREVFRGESPVDVIVQHVGTPPTPPSEALGKPVSPDLERLVLRCLEKKPDDRFADAGELLAALERCEVQGTWTQDDARAWWQAWRERHPEPEGDGETSTSHPSGYEVEMGGRLPSA